MPQLCSPATCVTTKEGKMDGRIIGLCFAMQFWWAEMSGERNVV